ncbi:MAG: metallophosphoesterase family protein [Hydrogeniiclostridium sp.]
MKKWLKRGAAMVIAAVMTAQAALPALAAETGTEETLKIASLSDTHYLSPTLIKDTEDFTTHLNSDRKMFAESDAFVNALLDTIKKDDPDVLLISGDLTKDGEKEGHEALEAILEKFEEETDTKVYITPGNHDLNNSNAMNFNTADGVAVPAGRTTQEDYKKIYADLIYNDDSVIATFTPAEDKQGGGLSYVARPKDGFTIISIDSARYSADNTESGLDEHETSGAVSADLEQWVVEQITAAKERGDTVIGLQHHGMVPHFTMEPDLLPMYLVNDYERLAQVYADAGMSYIFTGHMHANDIATVTTEAGNTLYDIETGSVVTYPSPARAVTLTRSIDSGIVKETMDVKTYTHVGPIPFTDPLTGEERTIEDMTEYGRQHGFSNDMLTTTVNGFLHSYYAQAIEAGGIRSVIESLVSDLVGMDLTVDQLVDVGLPLLLPTPEEGGTLYYDSDEGGMVIDTTGSSLELQILIPNSGLKQALNVLLDKVDALLEDPAQLDNAVTTIVESLTGIMVTDDKTLLDYVNYIYQSHLGGEDNGQQPQWVQDATAKIENGELVDQVIDVLVQNIASLLDTVLDNLTVTEVLGITGWDNNEDVKNFIAAEGRTPLLSPYKGHNNTETTLALIFGPLGAGWTSSDNTFTVPSADYTLGQFLDDFNDSFAGRLYTIDLGAMLDELINGTPADPEEGTEATEGLITEEIRNQLGGWLLSLVNSMGTDSNHPEDNNTEISVQWKLLTDRTALDAAIEKAERLDLSQYTEASAKAVKDALTMAKSLPQTASQDEMNTAAKNLEDAMTALQKVENSQPENSESDNSQKPEIDNPQNSDETESNAQTSGNEVPQTGENRNAIPLIVLLVSGGCVVLLMAAKKIRIKAQ